MNSKAASVLDHGVLWRPSLAPRTPNISKYMEWLGVRKGLHFANYEALWRWSVDDLEQFWGSIWDYFNIRSTVAPARVLASREMPGARWFPDARLNYAEHVLGHDPAKIAIIARSQSRVHQQWTYAELGQVVARIRTGLKRLGVGRGDRVAAYMPNIPEAAAAFLATASLGAIWSSCAPEFGTRSVIDRFQQIEPKVLLAVDGYRYGARQIDRSEQLKAIVAALPGLHATVVLPYGSAEADLGVGAMPWENLVQETGPLEFDSVPFDHPLCILYSSGTTGLPKAIVHGHGGILVEHFKMLSLHLDLTPDDRFFWFSTTGWMMWNVLVSGMLLGVTIVMFDGDPAWPDPRALWQLAEQADVTYFGVSAAFLSNSQSSGMQLRDIADLSRLRGIGSTGSPLPPATAKWIYTQVDPSVQLGSGSGGTDICSGFLGAVPILPVLADEMSCRYLGAKVESFDESGKSIFGAMGELVITAPMPSMPLFLWGDDSGAKYRAAYFDRFPGIWRHGDWITITEHGGCTIHGRSDATLNRGGVRLGTAEYYAVVEALPWVADSLVVHLEEPSQPQ